jgi:hypothetical protein
VNQSGNERLFVMWRHRDPRQQHYCSNIVSSSLLHGGHFLQPQGRLPPSKHRVHTKVLDLLRFKVNLIWRVMRVSFLPYPANIFFTDNNGMVSGKDWHNSVRGASVSHAAVA